MTQSLTNKQKKKMKEGSLKTEVVVLCLLPATDKDHIYHKVLTTLS